MTRILRTRELADRLGISRTTVWRYCRDGRLPPAIQIGPGIKGWSEDEVTEWLAELPRPQQEAAVQGGV